MDPRSRGKHQLGISCGYGHATPDGKVRSAAYCRGLCATAPSAGVDNRPVGRLTPARLDALVKQVTS